MRAVFPTKAILLLIGIGFLDLVVTAYLYSRGLITERNPIMRSLLERGEWLFVFVKGATLVIAWYVMARYCRYNIAFVRSSCVVGSCAYLLLWVVWFFAGNASQ